MPSPAMVEIVRAGSVAPDAIMLAPEAIFRTRLLPLSEK